MKCSQNPNSATIIKAWKLLVGTKSETFFKFCNQDIPTVYDPPCLLKLTQNLFLKYDLQLRSY
jgi:hypothetical protein